MSGEKRRRGRPNYRPSKKDRRIVRYLASYGIPQEKIALILGRPLDAVNRLFSLEIQLAEAEKVLRVAEVAYRMAVSGRSVSMTQFYLKTRGRWREADKLKDTVSDKTVAEKAAELRTVLQQMDELELS